jgi:MoxR-like ATPase
VLTLNDAAALMRTAESVHLAPAISSYIVSVAAATRELAEVRLGASPRGSLALARAARVRAASQGRGYVTPADVKALAVPVLAHRVLLTTDARTKGMTPQACVEAAAASVPVPHQLPGR